MAHFGEGGTKGHYTAGQVPIHKIEAENGKGNPNVTWGGQSQVIGGDFPVKAEHMPMVLTSTIGAKKD